MKKLRMAVAAALLAGGSAAGASEPFALVPGSIPPDRGPDGNSIFLDAPDGLILIDTGRHADHAAKLLDHARQAGKPIAAIINSHWHMDHVQGNIDVRRDFPSAHVYATPAIDNALRTFLANGRKGAQARLADPKTPPGRLPEIRRYLDRMAHPDAVRPTIPVRETARMAIAGRALELHVAPFAVTEADLWIYDPAGRVAIVGDLVVDIVPFMDTACPDGWKRALDAVAATPFETLVPGHGAPMDRARFTRWKAAFDAFVDCGRSKRARDECVAGWKRDASPFIDADHAEYVSEAAAYYIDTRLRSSPEEQQKYCRPLL